jgi:hypothetical protein
MKPPCAEEVAMKVAVIEKNATAMVCLVIFLSAG